MSGTQTRVKRALLELDEAVQQELGELRARAEELQWVADALNLQPGNTADRHELALRIIASKGVPSHLTPYGSVRSIAAWALELKGDPFYRDGEKLFLNALSPAVATSGSEAVPDV